MCSILITNKLFDHKFFDVNRLLKLRGPDYTGLYTREGINFAHNLLSISGKFTPQPFVDNNIVAVFNGGIYNADGYDSDGHCLIPRYRMHGDRFSSQLDGEFAVCIADFDRRCIILSTDIFGSKPLWIAINGSEFGISTYRSPLELLGFANIHKLKPNTIVRLDLDNLSLSSIGSVYEFDLSQHKTTFNDWIVAFEQSIRKRTYNLREELFIGLSSGYDSGAIACALDQQRIDYHSYTILGREPQDIISRRIRKNYSLITTTPELFDRAHKYIQQNVEPFQYTISSSSSDYNEYYLDLRDDSGSNGLSIICDRARTNGKKIYLSGMGADEIFSDYGFNGQKIYPHSNFGGKFPEDLSTIFPWNSFYGSSMESYLTKEEYVAGAYGIETRYPFLDRTVVQEFLWLTADLKNSAYKSVLDNYLKLNNYPYIQNQKIGFSV